MIRRGVVALAVMALVLAAAAIGSALSYAVPWVNAMNYGMAGSGNLTAMDEAWKEVNAAMPFFVIAPWVATAALVVGVAALALAARGAQLSGTRTVSAPASTTARNPTTIPKSSPSSSNSSARSSLMSNTDAFR